MSPFTKVEKGGFGRPFSYQKDGMTHYNWCCNQLDLLSDSVPSAVIIKLPHYLEIFQPSYAEIFIIEDGAASADVYVRSVVGKSMRGGSSERVYRILKVRDFGSKVSAIPVGVSKYAVGVDPLPNYDVTESFPDHTTELSPFFLVRSLTDPEIDESVSDFFMPLVGDSKKLICRIFFNENAREEETVEMIYSDDGREKSLVKLQHYNHCLWETSLDRFPELLEK